MKLRNLCFCLVPMLSACAGDSLIMTGEASQPVAPEKVRLVLGQPVLCPYEVIAVFEISGWNFSRGAIVDEFRELAAEVGADSVQIQYLQKRDVGEFIGQARALRCLEPQPDTAQSSESSRSSSSS